MTTEAKAPDPITSIILIGATACLAVTGLLADMADEHSPINWILGVIGGACFVLMMDAGTKHGAAQEANHD